MSVKYTIDLEHKVIIWIQSGKIKDEEIIAADTEFRKNQAVKPDFNFLADLTYAASEMRSTEMLRELAQRDKNWRENVNSKIAVLAPRDITYGFARMYQVYSGESNDNYRIFRDAQEAVDWLGIPMSVLEKARADMAVDSGK